MNKKIGIIFLAVCLLSPGFVWGREAKDITDWYIKNFESEIAINRDSSLLVTEKITADCGNLPDKHGIFRVLPLQSKTDKGIIKTPIELVSITDFEGKAYNYQTIKSKSTITWKIGDAGKTVTGENNYKITYRVKNAVRFWNAEFDELYWNLSGNFWDIDIDNFSAKISFPEEISEQNAKVDYYVGYLGSKEKNLATYYWTGGKILNFFALSPLRAGQGITASVSFDKGIFEPYQPGFWEKYGGYFWYLSFLIPLAVFVYAFKTWQKYGKDPKVKSPIPPEFEIPDKITPIEMGMVMSFGRWKDSFITPAIIDLAVRGFITIEETHDKILFFDKKDTKLIKNTNAPGQQNLTETEKVLMGHIFSAGKESAMLSEMKKDFYESVPDIKKSAVKEAVQKGWIFENSLWYSVGLMTAGAYFVFFSFVSLAFDIVPLFLSVMASGIILLVFGIIMPRRTQKGADLMFRIKGFELYMKKAENYRQQFYEKENIFDKFLPYAIVFGIAGLWAKKMQLIYGQDYFKNYHPVWFVGYSGSGTGFDADSFTAELNSITTSISQSTSSYSGAAGSGGAGGGGGGGGGGGW